MYLSAYVTSSVKPTPLKNKCFFSDRRWRKSRRIPQREIPRMQQYEIAAFHGSFHDSGLCIESEMQVVQRNNPASEKLTSCQYHQFTSLVTSAADVEDRSLCLHK